ncbi:MAG: hypothetical protein ACK4OP_02385 [Gemmobacter sp.]
MKIIAWPPFGTISAEVGVEQRVQRSVALFSGRRAVSSLGPSRRVAVIGISALARGRSGAGYAHMLARLLDGGMNLVRVPLPPVTWHADRCRGAWRNTGPLDWTAAGDPLAWSAGNAALRWFAGLALAGVAGTADGWPVLTVSGLPPGAPAVRPGEVVRVWTPVPLASAVARALAPAHADATGAAVVRLDAALPSGVVSLGDREDGVFEVTAIPQAAQPVSGDWSFSWPLREVLPHEVPAGAEEVDPWR